MRNGDVLRKHMLLQLTLSIERMFKKDPLLIIVVFELSGRATWWRHQIETFSGLLDIRAGEFTDHQWISRTKANDAELSCFPWSESE